MSENAVSPLGAGATVVPAASASTPRSLAARAAGLLPLAGPLLALGLGAFLLGRRSLTIDEADAVAAATGPFGDVVERALDQDPAAAGYLALLQPIVQLDDGERWVRAPSVVAAAIAALLAYAIGRALVDRLAGVFASLALACAGSVVAVSQQVRPYTLAILAVTASTALFVLALRRDRPAYWALYALGSALLPFTHPGASAAVLAQILALALVTPRPHLRLAGPAVGFVALENALLLTAFAVDRNDAPDIPLTLAGLGEGLSRAGGWNPVVAVLALFGVVALASGRAPRGEPWKAALVGGLAVAPAVGLLAASLVVSVLPETALVIGAPGVALAGGAGVAALPERWMQYAAGGAAAVAALAGVLAWYVTSPTQDWRAAAALLEAEATPQETVVALPDRARPALSYYAPDTRLALRAGGSGAWIVIAGDPETALREARTVVTTPRYALLEQHAFGRELVVQHWVRP